jgi:hypothetical protein
MLVSTTLPESDFLRIRLRIYERWRIADLWVSQVSDRRKNHFKAVTGMGSGSPEWQGGYPIPKATPKRGVAKVKSQPEPRLALKKLESIRT